MKSMKSMKEADGNAAKEIPPVLAPKQEEKSSPNFSEISGTMSGKGGRMPAFPDARKKIAGLCRVAAMALVSLAPPCSVFGAGDSADEKSGKEQDTVRQPAKSLLEKGLEIVGPSEGIYRRLLFDLSSRFAADDQMEEAASLAARIKKKDAEWALATLRIANIHASHGELDVARGYLAEVEKLAEAYSQRRRQEIFAELAGIYRLFGEEEKADALSEKVKVPAATVILSRRLWWSEIGEEKKFSPDRWQGILFKISKEGMLNTPEYLGLPDVLCELAVRQAGYHGAESAGWMLDEAMKFLENSKVLSIPQGITWGESAAKLGRKQEAMDVFARCGKAIAEMPDQSTLRALLAVRLANGYAGAGEPGEAKRVLDAAREKLAALYDNQRMEYGAQVFDAYLRLGHLDEADALAVELIDLGKKNENRVNLGLVHVWISSSILLQEKKIGGDKERKQLSGLIGKMESGIAP